MPKPLFRVKPYAHAKYKYLARAKVMGKWQRRYFATEDEAIAFAQDQNARAERYLNSPVLDRAETKGPEEPAFSPDEVSPIGFQASADYSQLVVPAYTGPRIQRYFGDHWSMHLPFAYELMRELKPRVFVELGVWKGESYFTFCQSAAEHMMETRCYGIDTWRGDVHMGEHDPQIATDVAKYNRRYSSFSELKQMTFKEALPDFADGSIDLLHIDGAHTYENVKIDFESWLPKLSPHGVILFHDVMVRDYGCRVWKLWDEIARPGKSFVFEFGYGLGVWKKQALTAKDPEILWRLLGATPEEKKRINEHYVTAAAALALWRSTGNRPPESTATHPLHIQIFADQGHGYTEAASISSTLAPSGWQTVRFEHIERLRPERGRPWRIDPVDQPAFVNISSIKIIRDSDDAILYRAESTADFQQLTVSDGVVKQEEEGSLLLLATDGDPQLFLPPLYLRGTEDCRLEIILECYPAPASVLARQRQALEGAAGENTIAELSSALEASQAEIGRQRQALEKAAKTVVAERQAETSLEAAQVEASFNPSDAELSRVRQYLKIKDAEITTLQEEISQAHARWTQLNSDLAAQRSENRTQQDRSHALEAALQSAIEQARSDSLDQHSRNQDLQAQAELDAEQISALESEVRDLNAVVEYARVHRNQLGAELRNAQFQNGELQAQTELDAEQIVLFEMELRRLEAAMLEERAGVARLTAALRDAHYENRELQAQTELDAEQIEALEQARKQIRKIQEQANDRASRLGAVRDLQNSNMAGLRRSNAQLKRRLEKVAGHVRTAGQAITMSDPQMPATVDLIREDIRRIHDPSVWWKMAKGLGLLRLAHASLPRTAAERRALAGELKAGLREICQVLSSPVTTPEEVALEIPRLFQLRRQTRELLQSLRISSLVFQRSHIWNIVHWARRAASNLSGTPPVAALFDPEWYLGENPDLAASQLDPLTHYLEWGAREGRNPNPIFNSAWYLKQNPDVASESLNPLKHYWDFGVLEGRDPNPLFDTKWYLAENPDVAASGLNPLEHYMAHGATEGRDPHPLLNVAWYLSQNPEVAGVNPLEHYLQWGCRHGLSPHPLFDAGWYLETNKDVAAAGTDPLRHYLTTGAAEGREPHPLFDSKWYLTYGADLDGAGESPLLHYVLVGARERHSPQPMFDAKWYADNFPDARNHDDLLTHYLTIGWRRGYKPSPYFDPQAYLKARPDVAESGTEPLTHFVLQGRGQEGILIPSAPQFRAKKGSAAVTSTSVAAEVHQG